MSCIVLPRSESDLDGIACAVAYSEFLSKTGIPAKPYYTGEVDSEAQYSINLFPQVNYASLNDVNISNSFILVDASDIKGFPPEIDPLMVTEVIDHRFHSYPQDIFKNASISLQKVGAAATIIAELFKIHKIEMSLESALMLYGAIHSNTLCLKGSICTERDISMSNWIEEQHTIPSDYLINQFDDRRVQLTKNITNSLLRERKEFDIEGIGDFGISQLEFLGASKYLIENTEVIASSLNSFEPITMLNMVDLESAKSFIYIPDTILKTKIHAKLNITDNSDIVEFDPPILRKQILRKLKG